MKTCPRSVTHGVCGHKCPHHLSGVASTVNLYFCYYIRQELELGFLYSLFHQTHIYEIDNSEGDDFPLTRIHEFPLECVNTGV